MKTKKQHTPVSTVEFDEANIPSLIKLIEMERYLQKLLRKKVDLVIKSGVRTELRSRILQEVIYI
jgi:predicted nucleotidyltransferase